MILANCGPDGCEPLPEPLRWIVGAAIWGTLAVWAVVWLYGKWRDL